MTEKINTQELGKDLQGILEAKGIVIKAKECKEIVEEFVDAIFKRVNDGETVKLGAYADLEPRTRAARKGRNPATGEEIDIAESRAVGLKPHKKLKDLLKG
ncbi:HU family DNA-binding protein [Lysinibacillus sp. BPa_S21]|uniref:HU family DNA-binding protein n=1 Tax=Lysinibacillus sp. BPa_S21 TaxID=2932478 RepID=UPI0020113970|nr:HU family DNA-binding protein [Lysinibacillus sp. BPa_S21]MCL1696275.1 HU family DNA-binding protein [Lysinibacillus sp. BPa_S21]